MLYNLGQMKLIQDLTWKVVFVAVCIATAMFTCVAISIMTRIGNFILGW